VKLLGEENVHESQPNDVPFAVRAA
jgi:hypothetical protein